MSKPNTYEENLMRTSRAILDDCAKVFPEKLAVLEAVASIVGGFDFAEYQRTFKTRVRGIAATMRAAKLIIEELRKLNIPPSIGVSILAREPIHETRQKETGAFYTDFRLAQSLASKVTPHLRIDSDVADLSSGTGILLSAVCEIYKRSNPNSVSKWVSEHVYAFDLSSLAVRGVRAALSCYLKTVSEIVNLSSHLKVQDSLFAAMPQFDIIVGNPPWGRIKLSHYAFAKRTNKNQTYGATCQEEDSSAFFGAREKLLKYAAKIKAKYNMLSSSEPDMYMAFLQAGIEHLRIGGFASILVPAGFIRSQGMASFRKYMFNSITPADIALFDNKARFFSIDTRFKFILLSGIKGDYRDGKQWRLSFTTNSCKDREFTRSEEVEYSASELASIRSDLSIPECRTEVEKRLFVKICKHGVPMAKCFGRVSIMRELDMTLDKEKFKAWESHASLPVIEGRMVQPFRFGSKSYVSGEGRKAVWKPTAGAVEPQFYVSISDLSKNLKKRTQLVRAGFCDIAGQTNERGMMSALIPTGVVCGNKVPTVVIGDGCNLNATLLWIGIVNSFVFDWLLRRVLTTTVNFYLLNDLPFPKINSDDALAHSIIEGTKRLCMMGKEYYSDNLKMRSIRAEVDVAVAKAYGLTGNDMEVIMRDFRLLDRGQPPIRGESRSTVTRDLVCSMIGNKCARETSQQRFKEAVNAGAKAYILNEMRILTNNEEKST